MFHPKAAASPSEELEPFDDSADPLSCAAVAFGLKLPKPAGSIIKKTPALKDRLSRQIE